MHAILTIISLVPIAIALCAAVQCLRSTCPMRYFVMGVCLFYSILQIIWVEEGSGSSIPTVVDMLWVLLESLYFILILGASRQHAARKM